MIHELMEQLIDSTGLQVSGDEIQITETPPLLPTRLRAAETSAAALGAQAVHPTEPSYPTVDLYPTQDHRWVMTNGGYPKLRDSLLELLNGPDSTSCTRGQPSPT